MTPRNSLPIIGLGSRRQVGKDSLARLMRQVDGRVVTHSFAWALKNDLDPLIREQFGFSAFTSVASEKELIRPLLIAYGMAWRTLDQDHWVKRVVADIDELDALARDHLGPVSLHVVTDVRFPNEAIGLRARYTGRFHLVDVTRLGAPPPTEEEQKHLAAMQALADRRLYWGNEVDETARLIVARMVLWFAGMKHPDIIAVPALRGHEATSLIIDEFPLDPVPPA